MRRTRLLATCLAAGVLAAPATASAACEGENEPVTAGNVAGAERALLCLVNAYRAENGRGTLLADLALQRAARGHAEWLEATGAPAGHVGADGSTPATRAAAEGYPYGVGENAFTSNFPGTTPREAFEAFRSSPGHNENMLDPTTESGARVVYQVAGMGFAVGPNNGVSVVQVFGLRINPATQFDPQECAAKTAKLRKAKQRVRQARKQLRRADTNSEEAIAERKLKRAKKRLRAARKAKREACPTARL